LLLIKTMSKMSEVNQELLLNLIENLSFKDKFTLKYNFINTSFSNDQVLFFFNIIPIHP
jgi:hypothetical protein